MDRVTAPVPDEASFFDASAASPLPAPGRPVLRGRRRRPLLRPLYPEEDLGPAADRLTLFLMQYWGGPNSIPRPAATRACGCGTRRSGSPGRAGCLAAAHARGGRSLGLPEPHRGALWDYLEKAASSWSTRWDPAKADALIVSGRPGRSFSRVTIR